MSNRSVTATFPWDDSVDDLGATWKSQASTVVDGHDTDTCPNDEGEGTLTQASFPPNDFAA